MSQLKTRFFVLGALALALLSPSRSAGAQQPAGDSAGGLYVTVFGAKIYYLDRGTGPVIVLVHGLGDEGSIWKQSIGPLARNHHVIALDLIGFGHSDKPLLDYRPDTFVDFLGGFLHALHIGRASFVGNSLGGWVAAELTLLHPELVDRLVLVDAGGYGELSDHMDRRMALALRLSTREDYRYLSRFTFYDKKFYPSDAFLDYAMTERVKRGDGYTISKSIESLLRREDVLDNRLGGIKRPTLIVWGRGDRLVPVSVGEKFKRDIKGSHLVVLEKCGHIPQLECPAELNAALVDFFQNADAKHQR